jgi:3-hydroxyacyl-[acyl-carrier-protein] dehydratase
MILDRAAIEALLPHRDPFLLVDRVVELEVGVRAVAEHDVTADAYWVPGHFPAEAVMPGVLIAEAMAQTAALAFLAGDGGNAGKAVYLVGYDRLRFRKPVRPGSVLRLDARLQDVRRRMATFDADAFVDGERVANGTLIATVP